MEVIEDACDNNTEIHGYNTDAVYCERPRKEYPIKNKEEKFTPDMIGKVFQRTGKSPSLTEKNCHKDIDISEYTLERGSGTLITGGVGCGKTTKLIKDAQ